MNRDVCTITIGGEKGHEVEKINATTIFAMAYQYNRWKMIPNCTDRYTCRDHKLVSQVPPNVMLRRLLHRCNSSSTGCDCDGCTFDFHCRSDYDDDDFGNYLNEKSKKQDEEKGGIFPSRPTSLLFH